MRRFFQRPTGPALAIVAIATLVAGILPLHVVLSRLTLVAPGDPPGVFAVDLWPLSSVKYAVGLMLGPVAGFVTGLGNQVLNQILIGQDVGQYWAWTVGGAVGGLLAGAIPRALPAAWGPSGRRRLAGAAVTGLSAAALAFLLVPLDAARTGASVPVAWAQYATVILPNAVLAAAVLPLTAAAAEALSRRGSAVAANSGDSGKSARPSPSWRPFAVLAAVLLVLPPLVAGPSEVLAVGAVPGSGSPQAAPGPGSSAPPREAILQLGAASTIDASCLSEGRVRSEVVPGPPAEVELVNESGRDLAIAWLDYQGRRDVALPIEVAENGHGQWWTGHLFLVARPDGTCAAIFRFQGVGPMTLRFRP